MNDRYLYRAKRTDNGEWVEGYFLNVAKINAFICTGKIKLDGALKGIVAPEMHAVDQSTICQYTGLTGKNGKKIWENDICIIEDGTLDEEDSCFICKWDNCTARYILDGSGLAVDFDNIDERDIEVIGNVFDNAELLEVKE